MFTPGKLKPAVLGKTKEPAYLDPTKASAKGVAIFFATGAVSGTVLSFELGGLAHQPVVDRVLLWSEFIWSISGKRKEPIQGSGPGSPRDDSQQGDLERMKKTIREVVRSGSIWGNEMFKEALTADDINFSIGDG